MKASPNTAAAAPITADQLLEILANLGLPLPPNRELAALAAELTKLQCCNDPWPGWWENPNYFTIGIKGGPTRTQTPVHLQVAYARGQAKPPWERRKTNWRDLAPDIAAGFRRLYPDETFGDRDGAVAAFIAAVIPLIFPGQRPSANAIGQYLARWLRKARAHR